jgi:hypothetical protein
MHKLRTYLLLILSCSAAGRLSEETIRFVEDYFRHKSARIITSFTCSKHGTDIYSQWSVILRRNGFIVRALQNFCLGIDTIRHYVASLDLSDNRTKRFKLRLEFRHTTFHVMLKHGVVLTTLNLSLHFSTITHINSVYFTKKIKCVCNVRIL